MLSNRITQQDEVYTRSTLKYIQDIVNNKPATNIEPLWKLPGWFIGDVVELEVAKKYETLTFKEVYGDLEYSRYQIGINVYRGAAVYLLKILPPVGIPVPFFPADIFFPFSDYSCHWRSRVDD